MTTYLKMASKEYIDDRLKASREMGYYETIKGVKYLFFWNYSYIADARKVAAALRRRGYSATVQLHISNRRSEYEVYYRKR